MSSVTSTGLADYLLDLYGGASAAYSLRKLNGSYNGSVVRVRRESDNAERDFRSSEINSGAMVRWVNEQITPPLDLRELTPTGRDGPIIEAAAAYSLRNLSDSYTGNVVLVRRSSDDTEAGFTAAEVSNGTLLAWVNTDVVTYTSDFSAGVDGWGVVRSTAASDAGPIGGQSDVLRVTNDSTASNTHYSIRANAWPNTVGINVTISMDVYIPSSNSIVDSVVIGNRTEDFLDTFTPTLDSWVSISTSGITGAQSGRNTAIAFMAAGGLKSFTGNGTDVMYIRNVVATQTTADGHVTTWYDQSGNTKHATQGTPASQPKIVDAGVLVAGGIDFDGVDDFLNSNLTLTQPVSIFGVYKALSNDSPITGSAASSLVISRRGTGEYIMFSGSSLAGGVHPSTEVIASCVFNGASSTGHWNGIEILNGDAGSRTDFNYIGLNSTSYHDGSIQELIIYDSDQSDNRTAFEANIGEVYGIAGIPAYDNTVNGFVETWYDQSGNGNDASQLTAGSQPKIVDAGVLVLSNGNAAIKATAGSFMGLSMALLSADGQQSVFSVLENNVTSQDGFSTPFRVLSSSTVVGGVNRRPYWFLAPDGDIELSVDSLSGYVVSEKTRRLLSHVMSNAAGGTSTTHKDGIQVDTRSITLDTNASFSSGRVAGVGTGAVGALYMSEVIYYPSDQSANRPAIEDNIDNYYGIIPVESYVNAAGDSYINAAGDTYLQP